MDYILHMRQPELSPISENEMRRAARGSRGASIALSKRLDKWKYAAFNCWKEQRIGPAGEALGQHCVVVVDLGFHYARRRDPHNYVGTVVKSMIDGLVSAGLWPDDNPEWVSVGEPVLTVHTKVPNTVLLPCKIHLHTKEG